METETTQTTQTTQPTQTTRTTQPTQTPTTKTTGTTGTKETAQAPSFASVQAAEYPGAGSGYLDTAALGLAPARTVAALRHALDAVAAGRPDVKAYEAAVAASRASYARLTGVPVERVALASTVAESVGLIATALPRGAEVVVAEGDFSSLVHPFAGRGGLRLRIVPLERVAEAVGARTALVAVSAAQSADGRVADLAAIRGAAAAHGARVLVDATQAVGWLPLRAGDYDYMVCHAYKWLLSPHGACFLTVREDAEGTLSPGFAGWYAGEDPWQSCYGPIERLAPGARRFDARPAYLPFVGAAASLSLLEELTVEAVRAHDLALADRLRAGLGSLGYAPVPASSAIVCATAYPPSAPDRLTRAGIRFSLRAGSLRFSLHVNNSSADVDRTLDALA